MTDHVWTKLIMAGGLVLTLAACGATSGSSSAATSAATSVPTQAAPEPTLLPTSSTTTSSTLGLETGISGTGEVKAVQDSNLSFTVQGTVSQVLVKEGDTVSAGQVLAILDVRSFDLKIEQSQAALDSAIAQQEGLNDPPKAADLNGAQAQIRQSRISLTQTQVSQDQNIRTAQSSLSAAQINLQSQRDKLSQAKTSAENQLQQAAQSLTSAQAAYAKAKSDWDYIQDTGQNPSQPNTTSAQGKAVKNKLNDSQREQYYQALVQAEASMHQAELKVQQSQVDFDQARQAELSGIQSSQEQVNQAQASLDKLTLPANADQVASSQAALDQSLANLAKLYPAPSATDKARQSASVRQSQASLSSAKLDRENAELRAPFAGVIAQVNIDPGDPSSTSGEVPIQIIDVSTLHVDVPINYIDIGQVQLGQVAQLSTDAQPGKTYSGKVSYIAPTAKASGGVNTYVVRIVLDDQAGLRPGMSMRVQLSKQ